jgi:hypothetical protein
MVAESRPLGDRDRAQLFLVGAIAIAMIILGIVVVINTVLYTESVTSGEAIESTTDAGEFDRQARRNVRSLVLRINHEQVYATNEALEDPINSSLADYSALLAESYASQRPSLVNITYHNGSSEFGRRIVQQTDGAFRSPGPANARDWALIPPAKATNVGRFIANFNVTDSKANPTNISVSNASTGGSDDYVNMSFKRVGGTSGRDIQISSERSFGGNTSKVRCDPSGARVLLDLMNGNAFTDDCQFSGIDGLEPPYHVSIANGENARGKFSLVANWTNPSYDDGIDRLYDACVFTTVGDDPCQTPAVWAANVTVSYQSDHVHFRQRHNVSVYP